jgi:5'-nucleotidase
MSDIQEIFPLFLIEIISPDFPVCYNDTITSQSRKYRGLEIIKVYGERIMKKLHLLGAVCACLLPLVGTISYAAPSESKVSFWLTVLHANDGESSIVDSGFGLEDFGGVARFKTVIDNLRHEATREPREKDQRGGKRGAITLSSGDNILAGPEFNASLSKGVPYYDTIAMDLMGFDAIAIGNHDFDFGPDVLADFIEGYTFTQPRYLSTNLNFSSEPRLQALFDQNRIARSTVIKKRGELIGIISAITPELSLISSPRYVVVNTDVAGAVQAEVDKLESMGVNKIILISHMRSVGEDITLVSQVTGVDVVLAGGDAEVLANADDLLIPGDTPFGPYPMTAVASDGSEVPVVTTAGSYGYVGKLVVGFDKNGSVVRLGEDSGPVRVVGDDCNGHLPCDDAVVPDPQVQTLVVDPVVAALGALDVDIIANSEVDLDGRRSSVRSQETNVGNLLADSLLSQANQLAASFGVATSDVALLNGGGIRNDAIIPAGPLTELDTFSMAPFPNFVTVLESIPRAQFKEVLENAVSRSQPGDIPGGTGRFAQVAGFSFVYSATGTAQVLNFDGTVATPGTRVRDVVLDDGTVIVTGGIVQPGSDLNITVIDFLARGGDQYPFRGAPFTILGVTYQQALVNYLVDTLGGIVSAAQYPFGGEGRITEIP